MDSTAEDGARKAKRTSGAGGADLISGLDEDVLLRVLELVDTRDALRTCVLSRRWLGLWKRIPKLRFVSCWPALSTASDRISNAGEGERRDALKRQYVSCVNDILAERRGDDDASEQEEDYYGYPFSSVGGVLDRRDHSPVVAMAADAARERCAALELSALQQFVARVNDVLARRARSDDCAIESLVISYATGADTYGYRLRKQVASAFVDAAQGWIQYAFGQQGLKSLVMDLHGLKCYLVGVGVNLKLKEEEEQDAPVHVPVVLLHELPNPPLGMETLHLALGGAIVRLPAPNAMRFASLVDLSLENMMLTNGGARLLAHLVSPANCPRLQKLRMNQLRLSDDDHSNDEKMRLESSVLSELRIDHVNLMASLELATPGLRIFHIDHCAIEKLTVSAPGLEEFAFFQLGYPPRCVEVDGELRCVRSLRICLRAFRSSYAHCSLAPILVAANNANVLLLGHCISITSLDVTLQGQQTFKTNVDLIRSMVPQLPQITSLTVNVSGDAFHLCNFGTSVASILTRFSNLRNLSLHLPAGFFGMQVSHTTYPDHWMPMPHLTRVELTGLSTTELWFLKAMLESAKSLCMMTVSFTAECWKQKNKMAAYKQMLHDEGMTTSHGGEFRLTCHKQSTHA